MERSWPAARTCPLARNRALGRLQAEADAGDQRSAQTLAALLQAAFDLEYTALATQLYARMAGGDHG